MMEFITTHAFGECDTGVCCMMHMEMQLHELIRAKTTLIAGLFWGQRNSEFAALNITGGTCVTEVGGQMSVHQTHHCRIARQRVCVSRRYSVREKTLEGCNTMHETYRWGHKPTLQEHV